MRVTGTPSRARPSATLAGLPPGWATNVRPLRWPTRSTSDSPTTTNMHITTRTERSSAGVTRALRASGELRYLHHLADIPSNDNRIDDCRDNPCHVRDNRKHGQRHRVGDATFCFRRCSIFSCGGDKPASVGRDRPETVERFARVQNWQRWRLGPAAGSAEWSRDLSGPPVVGCVLANEVLDNFPGARS